MRRANYPYNNKRYLWNKNTNELHDLDNEKLECRINEIKTDHIKMFDYISDAKTYITSQGYKFNGCYWCLRDYHIY